MAYTLPKLRLLPAKAALLLLLLPGLVAAQPFSSYTFSGFQAAYIPNSFDSTLNGGFQQVDDGVYRNVRLGFSMDYAGSPVNAVSISANGFIKLGTEPVRMNGYMPGNNITGDALADAIENNIVAVLNMDLIGYQNRARVSIQREGAAPARFVTIQWTNMRRFGNAFNGTDSLDFQVMLHEDGKIQMRYGRMMATSATASGAQVGIRGNSLNEVYALTGPTFTGAFVSTTPTTTLAFSNLSLPPWGYTFQFAPGPRPLFDASVRSLVLRADTRSGCPLSATEPLQVTVRNSGVSPISDVMITPVVNGVAMTQIPHTFNPALTTGQEAVVDMPVNLTSYGGYRVQAIVTLPGDSVLQNDSVSTSFVLIAPTPVPGPTPVTDLDDAAAKGWLESGTGLRAPGAGTTPGGFGGPGGPPIWQQGVTSLPGTIFTQMAPNNVGRTPWLFRTAISTSGEAGLSFRLAVGNGQGNPAPSVYDDSLKVMYTDDCGLTWQPLATFSATDLASGRISNQLRTFTYRFSTTPGIFSVGFQVKDNNTGTPNNGVYRWFLDDIAFVSGTNLSVDTALVPAPAGILTNYCARRDLSIPVVVTNNGVSQQDSIVLGYSYDNGPVATQVFRQQLNPASFAVLNLTPAGPGREGIVRLRIFSINAEDQIRGDDTLTISLLVPPAQSMTGTMLYGLQQILNGGYYQAAGNTETPVGSGLFTASTAYGAGDPTAAFSFHPATPQDEKAWLISPMYYYNGVATFRYRIAVTASVFTNLAATSPTPDTLRVLYRLRCGAWQTLRTYTQADVASGMLTRNLTEDGMSVPAGSPDSLQFAFQVTRGISNPADSVNFAWHITQVASADAPIAVKSSLALPGMSLYPVPAGQMLSVAFGQPLTGATLLVRDLSGRTLLKAPATGDKATLDVRALPAGLYTLQVQTAEGTVSRPFSKQ